MQREEGRSGEWEKPGHNLFVSELEAGLTFPSRFSPGEAVPCHLTSNRLAVDCSLPHRRWYKFCQGSFLWLETEPEASSWYSQQPQLNVPLLDGEGWGGSIV